jgi:hypothetical protein
MVAAANPLAVEAGLRVLRDGGTAVDAAVAVQTVLGLVEPQSSGLGGGSFLVFYDARTGKVTAYDGREKAPQAATPATVHGAGRQAAELRDRRPFRPFDGRAGGCRHAGPGPEGARQGRLEHAVQGRRAPGRRRLHGQSAHGRHDQQPARSAERGAQT